VYNPSDDSWSNKTALPISSSMAASVINDKIFAIIKNGENELWELFMYDSVIDSWIKKATPVSPIFQTSLFSSFTFTVADDKLIVCQITYSYYWDSANSYIHIYDPMLDKWSEGESGPETYVYGYIFAEVTSGVYAPKKLYVFGYEQNDQSLQAFTWVYDPVNDVWSTAKAMPACSVIAADQRTYKLVVADDLFYMIGGNNFNAQYIPIGYSPGDLVSSKLAPSLMLFAGATFASIVIVMVLVFLKRQSKNSTLDGV
jgi:hypothetical protein